MIKSANLQGLIMASEAMQKQAFFSGAVDWVADKAKKGVNAVTDAGKQLVGGARNLAGKADKGIAQAGQAINNAYNGAVNAGQQAWNATTGAVNNAYNGAVNAANNAYNTAANAANAAGQYVGRGARGIQQMGQDAYNATAGALNSAGNALTDFQDRTVNAIDRTGRNLYHTTARIGNQAAAGVARGFGNEGASSDYMANAQTHRNMVR